MALDAGDGIWAAAATRAGTGRMAHGMVTSESVDLELAGRS
jgi:hypothetical protein